MSRTYRSANQKRADRIRRAEHQKREQIARLLEVSK